MQKVLIFICTLLIFPLTVNAEYLITDHLIDAEIEIAGGLRIKELIVVNGTTNYFSRNINYKNINEDWDNKTIDFKNSPIYNGYSLENVKVSAFKVNEPVSFDNLGDNITYFQELNPKNIKDDVYTLVKNDLGANYNIYHKINNEKYAYYIEYLVSNVVVIHEDVAEINYTFKNLDLGAQRTLIRIIIPYPTIDDKYHFWVHGPAKTVLNELVNTRDEKVGFLAQIEGLKSDVNFRMTLPKEQVGIPIYLNHSGANALPEIKKIEAQKISQINLSSQILNIIKYIFISFSIIYGLGSIIILKYSQKLFFGLYLGLGLVLIAFNYLSRYRIVYLYFIILIPIIIKLSVKIKRKQ